MSDFVVIIHAGGSSMANQVFVGGTYLDNVEFRQAAYAALRRRALVTTMEDFTNSELTPPETCKQRLEECTHYLLIIGERYGWEPPGYGGLSITELEYQWARKMDLPTKIYIYKPDGESKFICDNPESLQAFKEQVSINTVREFINLTDLKHLLELTLRDWFDDKDPDPATPLAKPSHTININGNLKNTVISIGENNKINNTWISSNEDTLHEELGEIVEAQLESLIERRLLGDVEGAWNELQRRLEAFTISSVPEHVQARYYLLAANWTIIDNQNLKNSERYIKIATKLHPKIDLKSYEANKLKKDGKHAEALSILQPITNTRNLNTALNILLETGRGGEVEKNYCDTNVQITHTTRQLLSLCYLQNRNFEKAIIEIEKALLELPKSPIYLLTAGFIYYWRAIPEDFSDPMSVFPVLLSPGVFAPNRHQTDDLLTSLNYFEQARDQASLYTGTVNKYHIREAWLLTASLIQIDKESIQRETLMLLKEDSLNIVAFQIALEQNILKDEYAVRMIEQHETDPGNIQYVLLVSRFFILNKKNDKAIEILEKSKDEFFKENQRVIWLNAIVEALAAQKLYKNALIIIDECSDGISIEEVERIKCIIFSSDKEYEVDLLKSAKTLAAVTCARIDLSNLANYYRSKHAWKEAIEVSELWLQRYQDIHALELLVEAQSNEHLFKECLSSLDKNKTLFPDEKPNIFCLKIKMYALEMLGLFNEAINVASDIWKTHPNENILLVKARLNINEGDILEAITVLKGGLQEGFSSPHVYSYLSELLVNAHPEEAFAFMMKGLQLSPDNPDIYLRAIMVGFFTGNDDVSGKLLGEFTNKFPDSNLLQQKPVKSLLVMAEEYRQDNKLRHDLFRSGQVPLHLFLDIQNDFLGSYFYSHWQHNKNCTNANYVQLPVFYGGREMVDLTKYNTEQIYMDYTACLTAFQLNIFGDIQKAFKHIIVPNSLFLHMTFEIKKMKDIQSSRIEAINRLHRKLQSINLNEIIIETISEISDIGLTSSDTKEWSAAIKHNAYIVTEQFSTEMFNDVDIPIELKNLQVYPTEVIEALKAVGEIPIEIELPQYRKEFRSEVVEKLIHHLQPLVVDAVFLEALNEADCLDVAKDYFQLLIFDDLIESLKNTIESNEFRKTKVAWMDKLLFELKSLREKGFLIFGQASNRHSVKYEHCELVYESLAFGEDNEGLIWIDDRHLSSYSSSGKSVIVTVNDILFFLFNKGHITRDQYKLKLLELYQAQFHFLLPSLEYTIDALKLAKVDTQQYILIENRWLRILRRYLAVAFSEDSSLSNTKLQHAAAPEAAVFLIHFKKREEEILYQIWASDDMDDEWKSVASSWIFNHVSFSLIDVTHIIHHDTPDVDWISFKYSHYIIHGFQMVLKENQNIDIEGYFSWLFSRLNFAWAYTPLIRKKTIKTVLNFIMHVIESEKLNKYNWTIVQNYLQLFLGYLPDYFRDSLLDDPLFQQHTGAGTLKIVSIGDWLSGVPLSDWVKWVDKAVSRGSEVEGEEIFQNKSINVTYIKSETLSSDKLELEWMDSKNTTFKLNLVQPFAQLENSNSDIRVNWLKRAGDYLFLNETFAYYNKGLLSNDYLYYAGELKQLFNNSKKYFVENLKFEIQMNSERLPSESDLFPDSPTFFENYLSQVPEINDHSGLKWQTEVEQNSLRWGIERTLEILSSLPLGRQWSFSNVVRKLIKERKLLEHEVVSWILDTLNTTSQPVKMQNLLQFVLSAKKAFRNDNKALIRSTILKLVDIKNVNYSEGAYLLYNQLLKLAWRIMETDETYYEVPSDQRILWSYIYAGFTADIFIDFYESKQIDMRVVADTFEQFSRSTLQRYFPLSANARYSDEVASPEMASVWRTVIGGTLSALQGYVNEGELEFKLILESLYENCYSHEIKINGITDKDLSFEKTTNRFFGSFGLNNLQLLREILGQFESPSAKHEYISPEDFLIEICNKAIILNMLDRPELYYIYTTSRHSLPDKTVLSVKLFLEKFRISTELPEEEIEIRGKLFPNIINALPESDQTQFISLYFDDLLTLLNLKMHLWEMILEIAANLSTCNDINKASATFLSFVEKMIDRTIRIPDPLKEKVFEVLLILPLKYNEKCRILKKRMDRR